MVSLLFFKYDTNYYSTAGCRLSGEGFRLSIAFLSIFDAKGGALPFVFDATWMGNPLRWHLISMQRGWETPPLAFDFDATGMGNWLRCRLFSMRLCGGSSSPSHFWLFPTQWGGFSRRLSVRF